MIAFLAVVLGVAMLGGAAWAGDIASRAVSFANEGERLVGTLYLPVDPKPGLPAVVVTGSWTTVKEQMAATYAQALARRGYAGLVFDFRNFGESGGAVRAYESPAMKISDIKAAARFAATLPEVDTGRVVGLAVCASAGYMAQAIVEGAPLRSFVAVAGWFHDPSTVASVYGGAEGVAVRTAKGRAARAAFERTGRVDYVKAFDYADPSAAMVGPFDYYGKADRGAIAQWDNRFALMSWSEWLAYDAVAPAKALKVPSLFVHSDNAALPANVRAIYEAVAARKSLVWSTEGHFDFYDRPDLVERSADAAAEHFRQSM